MSLPTLMTLNCKTIRDRNLIPLVRLIEDVTKLKTTSEITPPLSVMKSILRTSESSMAKFSLLVCWNGKIGIKIYKSAILAQPKMDLRKLKWYVLFNWTSLNGPQKAPKVPRNYVFSLPDAKISNYENVKSKNNTYKHYLCPILLRPLIHTNVPGKWIVNTEKALWYSAFLVKDKTTQGDWDVIRHNGVKNKS